MTEREAAEFRWKPKPAIPKICFKQPVVLLDSGQSVDESVFLQYFRKWLHESILARSRNDAFRPHVHLYYPSGKLWARYGAKGSEVWTGDEWEVGTLRLPGKPLYPWGLMHTFAAYEDGCLLSQDSDKHSAPWRRRAIHGRHRNPNPKAAGRRRGVPIYLNPTERDVEFLRRHQGYWRNRFRCPDIILGFIRPNQAPRGLLPLVHSWYALNPHDVRFIRESTKRPWKGAEIPTKKFLGYMGGRASNAISIAPNWRNPRRNRRAFAASWIKDEFPDLEVKTQKRDSTWEELLDATDCAIYVILSEQETMPFDAYLAAARGAILVAPNTMLFKNIPMRRNRSDHKWLYTVRDYGHNRYGWSHTELRRWLIPRIKKWQQSQIRAEPRTRTTRGATK